jgi:uncharacterized protein YcbK (DUF882 family)
VYLINDQLTPNFRLAEIACRDADKTLYLTPDVVKHAFRLQKFRDWYYRPMPVNSWYRTKKYNAEVGGATGSMHLRGIATDVALPEEFYDFSKSRKNEFLSNVKNKWSELCKLDRLAGGVGFYDSFVHLDSREGEELAFWDYRK